ncbi:hypothetical protein MRX96_013251 [Rhipicephalus microplus]
MHLQVAHATHLHRFSVSGRSCPGEGKRAVHISDEQRCTEEFTTCDARRIHHRATGNRVTRPSRASVNAVDNFGVVRPNCWLLTWIEAGQRRPHVEPTNHSLALSTAYLCF